MSTDRLKDNEAGVSEETAAEIEALTNSNENLWKVVMIGLAFLILFSAFNSASVLITPIYEQLGFDNFGKISTLCIYVAFGLNDFLAPFELRTVGIRMGLFLGAVGYVIFMLGGLQMTTCHYRVGNTEGFCSSGSILAVNTIASIACGLSAAILWLAMAKYIDCCANKYNKGKFFGVFWSIFQASFILGNVLGAYLLSLFDPFIYFITMGSLVAVASISLLLLPPVTDTAAEQEITRPMFEDIKYRISGIKRITFMPAFRPLLPYFLFAGFSVAIYSTFPQKIINSTLGDASDNVKNEKTEWCYVGQGAMAVVNSFIVGKAFDKVGIKKTINVTNFGFIFSMILAIAANYYLKYGLALSMVVIWAFGDSSIRILSNAIIAKDFKGRLEAFAATRVITELGVVIGLLISIGLGNLSPYYFIGTIIGVTVVMQLLVLFYDSNKIHPQDLEDDDSPTEDKL